MGITKQVLKAILHENSYIPISGNILLIGKSTVCIEYNEIKSLYSKFDLVSPKPEGEIIRSKNKTKAATAEYFIDDSEIFDCLNKFEKKINILDVSDYEGADVVWDLNYPIPDFLKGKFDFIYDSSVLDNLFNVGQALSNICQMLKPGGRFLTVHHSSFFPGAMVTCHPEWFYSFFSINGFVDVKVYLAEHCSPGKNRFEFDTNLFKYSPFYKRNPNYNYLNSVRNTNGIYYTIGVFEAKKETVKEILYPTNLQYIGSSQALDWTLHESSYVTSSRPLLGFGSQQLLIRNDHLRLPHFTDHYFSIGSDF